MFILNKKNFATPQCSSRKCITKCNPTAAVAVFLGYLKNTESYNFSIILYTARLVSGERFSNLWIKG